MLLKSLQVLIAVALLALAAIVGFALLGFTGPRDTIDEAARHVARGELARAVALLDRAAPSVAGDPVLRERLLRLRANANRDLQKHAAALRDVDELLRALPADEALQLDRIRLLALTGNGQRALATALAFLERHPGHGRALELAGEACQLLYQPTLKALSERCERELPATERDAARTQLWSYLYRPAGDPRIAAALDALAAKYAREPRLQASWHSLGNELAALREQVQQALGYFRGSLEADGEPVAAFDAFALSLDLSQRIDDLLVACEIQRRRFTHRYVDAAGADATWALLREQQYPAALATAERWLLRGQGPSRTEFPEGTRDLLLARTWAAWHVGTAEALARADVDAGPTWSLRPTPAVAPLTYALRQLSWNGLAEAEKTLRFTADILAGAPPPIDRFDLLPPVATLWLDLLRRRGASEADVEVPLRLWAAVRPGSAAPLIARADVLLERGDRGTAIATLAEACALAADDERLFARYLEVMRAHAATTLQDGPSLLAQCLRRGVELPVVRHELGYLLCGETALAQGEIAIATKCANAAIDAHPLTRPPRLLAVRTAMARGEHAEAARQSAQLLQRMPPEPETVALALAAHEAARLDPAAVLAVALATMPPDPALQTQLVRAAVAERPREALAFITPAVDAIDAPAELRLVAAAAIAHAGDPERAARLLDAALASPGARSAAARADLGPALAAWCTAASASTPDAQLTAATEARLTAAGALAAPAAPAVLAAARALAATHPSTALVLASASIAVADVEDRNGADLALLGGLALRAGRWRLAEEHWTAALAFPDGSACAERLARLCLARGRTERALQVEELVTAATDAALAARCGRLERAATLVGADLLADPGDLLTHCTLALVGESVLTDWRPVADDERRSRLELLSVLHEPALAPLVLPRLRTLAEQSGPRHTNRLLLARALAGAGDGAGAAAIHRDLPPGALDDPIFLHEVAVAATAPGYEVPPAVRERLLASITSSAVTASPVTLAFAADLFAQAFAAGGAPAHADAVRWLAWRHAPRARPLRAADREWIVATQRPADAFAVLAETLRGPHANERGAVIDAMLGLAPAILAERPEQRRTLVAAARGLLRSDGARGSIVHFLLAHDVRAADASREEPRELLLAHLRHVAAGEDGERSLAATIAALQQELGTNATLATVDALLQAHPTALPLWVARTRLAIGTGDARAAIPRLRTVLRHVDAPELQLAAITWAAEARLATADDIVALTRLPAALRDAAPGRYAAAVLALRAGNPDAALPLFAAAEPRDDGTHLLLLGLAALQSRAADGPERARDAFTRLARDYASSSVARNAGSFASQLADR
jgi:hypothetical protein